MLTLKEAIKIADKLLETSKIELTDSYGEAQGQYIFTVRSRSDKMGVPGGLLTVDKETGETSWLYPLKREFLAPCAPIIGYKKLELTD